MHSLASSSTLSTMSVVSDICDERELPFCLRTPLGSPCSSAPSSARRASKPIDEEALCEAIRRFNVLLDDDLFVSRGIYPTLYDVGADEPLTESTLPRKREAFERLARSTVDRLYEALSIERRHLEYEQKREQQETNLQINVLTAEILSHDIQIEHECNAYETQRAIYEHLEGVAEVYASRDRLLRQAIFNNCRPLKKQMRRQTKRFVVEADRRRSAVMRQRERVNEEFALSCARIEAKKKYLLRFFAEFTDKLIAGKDDVLREFDVIAENYA